MDTHHHDSGSDASDAAAWLTAMIVTLVVGAVLLVAMLAWAPWDDDDTSVNPGTGTEEGAGEGDTDVDIEGDIDVDGGDADSGEEAAPSDSP